MAAKLSELTRRLVGLAAIPVLLAFLASGAEAQQGAIAGQVVDAQNAQPVAGAQVYIQGTQFGTLTGDNGRYRLAGVPAGEVTVRVRLLGYAQGNRTVTVEAGETVTVDFELRPTAITMEELVVTGTAAQTMRAKVPFDIASVSNEQMPVPSTTASSMLQGKVAGVTVTSGTGRPGSSPSILLRGATSIDASGRSQEPLFIVDGVIMGSSMADIGSLDIKNIEVVKGAAAASLYGSRAANGVIQITTEDGSELQDGTVNYTMRTEMGTSELEGSFFLPKHHEYELTADGSAIVQGGGRDPCVQFTACQSPQLAGNAPWRDPAEGASIWNTTMTNEWPGNTFDQVDLVMQSGDFAEHHISASGHSGGTNFHASFTYTDEQGVMPGKEGFRRYNVRLNLDQQIQEELKVSASAFYSTSEQDNFFENSGNPMFDLTRMKSGVNLQGCLDENGDLIEGSNCMDDPENLVLIGDPTNTESPNPLYQLLVQETTQQRGRFLGSADVQYSPMEWLTLQGNISYDRLDLESDNYYPKGYRTIDASALNDGFLAKFDEKREALNASVTATMDFDLTSSIRNTTKLRYLVEKQDNVWNSSSGLSFAVANLPNFGNITDQQSISINSASQPVRSDGYFVITNFDIADRYIVDLLARNDGSSLFGPDERRHWYYRAAGAWRVTQEDWFDVDAIDELKVRLSYGTAGGRPNFSAQYETYSVGGGRVTPQNLGNKDLKPEQSEEIEVGMDAIFLDRFVFSFTGSEVITSDQILPVPLASFSGFGTQWQNAGKVLSASYEASLQASIIDSEDLSWSTRLIWDKSTSWITELDRPAFRYGVGGQGLGNIFYAREGEQLGTFYGAQAARDCSHLPQGVDCSGFTVNDDGFLVWVGNGSLDDNNWGADSDVNIRGAPVKWGTPFRGECGNGELFCPVGNSNPDYRLSFSSTLNYKGFSLYGLLDAEQGFDVYNQPLEWAVFRRNAGMYDEVQKGTPQEDWKPVGYYDAWYGGLNGLAPDDEFVEDGSYVKLREVSASYRFSEDQLEAVPGLNAFSGLALTFTGRNLITWSDYRGFDPEVGKDGGDTGSAALARVAGYQYPNFRTWTAGIELNF